MAATDPSFPSSGNAPESGCGRGQEDPQQGSGPGETPMWTVLDSDPRGLDKKTPAGAAEAKHTHTHTFPGFYVRWPIAATSCPPSHCPNVLQMFSHSQLLVYTFHLTLVQPGNVDPALTCNHVVPVVQNSTKQQFEHITITIKCTSWSVRLTLLFPYQSKEGFSPQSKASCSSLTRLACPGILKRPSSLRPHCRMKSTHCSTSMKHTDLRTAQIQSL